VGFVRQHYPEVRLLCLAENQGFARAVNAGIAASRSEYVALLNNDTRARPAWLASLVRTMEQSPPEVGCLASKMLQMSDPTLVDDAGDLLSWQGAATKRGHGRPASEFTEVDEVFSPCAGAALYRRAFLEALGGFDERFFAYLEDVDLGLRGRLRDYRCLYVPTAEVLHHGHGTAIPQAGYVRLTTRNRLLLLAKNIPLRLLLKHAPQLLYGQLYFLIVHRKPWHSVAGSLAVLPLLPHVLRARRANLRGMRISPNELERMLGDEMAEPPLRRLVMNRLRRLAP
jgi:hypothetical protein